MSMNEVSTLLFACRAEATAGQILSSRFDAVLTLLDEVPCCRAAALEALSAMCVSLARDEAQQHAGPGTPRHVAGSGGGGGGVGQKRRRLANRSAVNAKSTLQMGASLARLLHRCSAAAGASTVEAAIPQQIVVWAVRTVEGMLDALHPDGAPAAGSTADLIARSSSHPLYGPALDVLVEAVRVDQSPGHEALATAARMLAPDAAGGRHLWLLAYVSAHFPHYAFDLLHVHYLGQASVQGGGGADAAAGAWPQAAFAYLAEALPAALVASVLALLGAYCRHLGVGPLIPSAAGVSTAATAVVAPELLPKVPAYIVHLLVHCAGLREHLLVPLLCTPPDALAAFLAAAAADAECLFSPDRLAEPGTDLVGDLALVLSTSHSHASALLVLLLRAANGPQTALPPAFLPGACASVLQRVVADVPKLQRPGDHDPPSQACFFWDELARSFQGPWEAALAAFRRRDSEGASEMLPPLVALLRRVIPRMAPVFASVQLGPYLSDEDGAGLLCHVLAGLDVDVRPLMCALLNQQAARLHANPALPHILDLLAQLQCLFRFSSPSLRGALQKAVRLQWGSLAGDIVPRPDLPVSTLVSFLRFLLAVEWTADPNLITPAIESSVDSLFLLLERRHRAAPGRVGLCEGLEVCLEALHHITQTRETAMLAVGMLLDRASQRLACLGAAEHQDTLPPPKDKAMLLDQIAVSRRRGAGFFHTGTIGHGKKFQFRGREAAAQRAAKQAVVTMNQAVVLRALRDCMRFPEATNLLVRQLAIRLSPLIPVPTPSQYLEVLPRQTGFLRDIHIQRVFDSHPLFWTLLDLAAEAPVQFGRCTDIVTSLVASAIGKWHGIVLMKAKGLAGVPILAACRAEASALFEIARKAQLLPSPLDLCGELVPLLTPTELESLLMSMFRVLTEAPPTAPGAFEEDKARKAMVRRFPSEARAHTGSLRGVFLSRMDVFGHLYAHYFRADDKRLAPS